MYPNKRNLLSLKEKHQILYLLDSGVKQVVLSKEFKVHSSLISKLKQDKEKILNCLGVFPESSKKLRKSPFEIIDSKLFEWFQVQRQKNITISSYILLEKADQIAKEEEVTNFICHPSWIERFKKRHSITLKTICGESKAVNQQSVNEWPLLRLGYEDKNIFNTDETVLLFKMLPIKTLALKKETCHGVKISKERLTVFLCASMLGEKK